MKIAIDNNILAWMLSDNARPPRRWGTNEVVDYGAERLSHLKDKVISGSVSPLIVPTPVVSEFFAVEPNAIEKFLPVLQDEMAFTLPAFGMASAIELAIINGQYYATGDKRGGSDEHWQKIKTDRQIFAIAKVSSADKFYTDDRGLTNLCAAIDALGGPNWKTSSIDDVIRWIEDHGHTFHVSAGGFARAYLEVKVHPSSGRKYLRTIPDGHYDNNLYALPECP